ncbi:GNAT family N-acetyltransferase [Cellulomonas sp. KRMCY2]|uniref:bifunctional acetate--CoA ligase family protein/GNAT family N-acetyltransferase n=1 Tax=Cellulomonas sp. KRMCY2 TaxID=1304865 RepID=UPI00045E79DC|nr:GNAT family N-acetyltransferase [Cellulomonas sp. KRMCY2]
MAGTKDDGEAPGSAPDGAGHDAGYPTHWEADVVLRDGGTAHVRPIRADDADALQAFHVGQSERSTYFRFFAPLSRLPERDLARFTHVDHHDRVALVAVVSSDEGERIIAVARYDRIDGASAEVAFNVADDHHGRGLGSVLLEHIAAAARERGLSRFTAEVLPNNSQMIAVFREAGYVVSQHLDDGILTVSFDIDPTERSIAVMADREQRAEARSVHGLLTPGSVLVLTDDPGPGAGSAAYGQVERELAQVVAAHLIGGGDAAVERPVVHVVGPVGLVEGAQTWSDVAQVPGPVDLLVLAVPAGRAAAAVRRCARLRPRGVVVLSSGFAETGPEGLAHQHDLLRSAHAAGMRVLGPASYGLFRHGVDGYPTVNASLMAAAPRPGRLALFCQSAPLAVGLLASARRRELGLSTFVSSGNRADVSGNDVMQFWGADESTDVVGLYLESIGNPRKFARVARRLASVKPVVVLTAGRSGHVVPAGHAVRSTRVPRHALEEMLRQSGVIRVESQHQLLDVAQVLVHQPLPAGPRVSVLAGSEPLAALVAEAATSAGLTVGDQRAILAGGGDLDADIDRLDDELAAVYADPGCDVVFVLHVPTVGQPDDRVAGAVARAAAGSGRTTVACILGLSGITAELTAADAHGTAWTVPAYATPEDGVLALAAAVRYSAWRGVDHGQPLAPEGVDRARARRLVDAALHGYRGVPVPLEPSQVAELLAAYGLRVWPTVVVQDDAEALAAAQELGWPVALKSTAARLRHRIDLGGVRLDIGGPEALVEAITQMRGHLEAHGVGGPFEVQHMAPAGAACVIRSSEDPRFGPVVSFGMAGDAVDLLGDISHGVAPLTDVDVSEMVRSVRAAPRLFGYRGLPALDVAALEDVLGRVAVMADDLPELSSLELHPVVVAERGAAVLAARVELAEAGRADSGRRVLPQ